MKFRTYKIHFLILSISIYTIAGGFLYWNTLLDKRTHIRYIERETDTQYHSMLEAYQALTDNFYNEHEDTIAEALYKVDNGLADPDTVRRNLYDRYIIYYNSQQLLGWRQLHIHLPNGVSFLRFHKPDKYGDSLLATRDSLRRINVDHRFYKGYEIGKFYDGFRFLYPLFFKGQFVGSMEWGQSFQQLVQDLDQRFGNEYIFMVAKSSIDRKLDPSHRVRYYSETKLHPDFVVFKDIDAKPMIMKALKHTLFDDDTLLQHLSDNTSLSKNIVVDNETCLVTLLPVKEIGGEQAAFLIAIQQDDTLESFDQAFYIEMLLLLVTLSIVTYRLYRTYEEQKTMRTLLDMQKDMVILSSGTAMLSANKALIDFFGYDTFHDFKKHHECICDLFINETGYLQKEVNGSSWLTFIERHLDQDHFAKIRNPKTGNVETFLLHMNVIEKGQRYTITLSNVTSIEKDAKELEQKATHDTLTGLYNRIKLDEMLDMEIKRFKRLGHAFSFTIFDIDHFKPINDTHGHEFGDEILIELARFINGQIRETDFLFRWGGEEFVILQPETDLEMAAEVCNRICNAVAAHRFPKDLQVTCSFGISEFRQNDSKSALFKRTDTALYRAKSMGRNRVETYR